MFATREEYLNEFIARARPHFERVNAPLPDNVRVAVGFTSKGAKGTRIGECWSNEASADGHFEIFIKPTIDGAARICDVLTHELVHIAAGFAANHGPAFKRVCVALGLEGTGKNKNSFGATNAGDGWYAWALPILSELGEMPYGALSGDNSTARKVQVAALLKVECPVCGFLGRVTKKHLAPHPFLNCPVPDCDGVWICEQLDG